MVVENAFGRLKGRWQCLLKRLDFQFENVVTVTATCVVLHNLCEKYGAHFDTEWAVDMQEQSSSSSPQSCTAGSRSTQAEDIRNAIKNKLSSE